MAYRVESMQLWETWRRMTGGGISMTQWRDRIGLETRMLFTTWLSKLLLQLWRWEIVLICHSSYCYLRQGVEILPVSNGSDLCGHRPASINDHNSTWCCNLFLNLSLHFFFCYSTFAAGELWHAIQPHWRWANLPEGLWWSEPQVREGRPGSQMLLRGWQDRTLTSSHPLRKGKTKCIMSRPNCCLRGLDSSLHFCVPWLCLLCSLCVMTPVTLWSTLPLISWWRMASARVSLLSAWRTDPSTASEPRTLSLLLGGFLSKTIRRIY